MRVTRGWRIVVLPLLAAFGSGSAVACAPAADAPVLALVGTDRAGDPLVEGEGSLRLAGLAPPADEAAGTRLAEALKLRSGERFTLVALGSRDRWGRLPARLIAVEGGADLAAALVSAGAARALADPLLAGCRDAVTASLDRGQVIQGHDIAALKEQAGRIVAVEGRIASVNEQAQRTYLNFDRRRGGAAVVLSRSQWRSLVARGWSASSLQGRNIRVQGVLGGRSALLIEPASLDALALLDR